MDKTALNTKASGRPASTSTAGPNRQELVTAMVVARRRISPTFARITLAGEGLKLFENKGYDQWFRMFFHRDGAERLPLPTGASDESWYRNYMAAGEHERIWMRYVTVSDYRSTSSGPQLDVDVVVHGEPGGPDSGPLSTWAQTVEPGERVGILDQGLLFKPEQAEDGVLIVGDETALPGIVRILKCLPSYTVGKALLEVPSRSDIPVVVAPAGVQVRWFVRQDTAARPAQKVLEAARQALLDADLPYVYAAGEANMAKTLNKLLVEEHDWPRERFTTVGYWHYSH